MPTEYSKYKYADYLADDFFVKTTISPTKESEEFWSGLIDEGKIDINEFISANIVLESIRKNKKDVSTRRVEQLWNRIEKSCHSRKRFRLYRYLAIAGCCAGLIGLAVSFFQKEKSTDQESILDFSLMQTINHHQTNNEIQIISGNQKMEISGKEAEVTYNRDGQLTVNNQSIDNHQGKSSTEKVSYNQLCVPYGKRASLTLSDGSKLWVNTGTTVVYPVAFSGEKREIYVDGEVYMEVMRDENMPFAIKTDLLEVHVLGTSFNLSAYKTDTQKKVVLVNGSVEIKIDGSGTTRIKPNQLFTYTDDGVSVETVDVGNYISWRDGIYIFKNEPIENILLQLARYYNVTLTLPQQLSGIACSGKLELKEEFMNILNGLSQIAQFSFAVKDNQYWIQFTE